jgi:hypothetical protein
MGSTYSESDDEDEYGGDDGQYDSFRDEFDNEDDEDDGRLEPDVRGRRRSVGVGARVHTSPRLDARTDVLEGPMPVQVESRLRDTNSLRDTTRSQSLQARRRRDPSQPDEGSETDEEREVQNSSFATVRNARHADLNDTKNPPATTIPLQSTVSSSSAPSRLPPVPLKPFRNQVGGHSAIYKFTKRAVCKVSSIC